MEKRSPESWNQKQIKFLYEQDGPSENELKARLTDIFRIRRTISSAYLACVDYGTGSQEHTVALCLRTLSGQDDTDVVNQIGATFASIFPSSLHMDIMFLSNAQESELGLVCRPFFTGPHSQKSP
jgi:hypothetical protein